MEKENQNDEGLAQGNDNTNSLTPQGESLRKVDTKILSLTNPNFKSQTE